MGLAGNIEHETGGASSRIVITKSWNKDCFRFIPLFDPGTIPSPTPEGAPTPAFGERSGAPSGLRPSSFVMCNAPVEVQFIYPSRVSQLSVPHPSGQPFGDRRAGGPG